MDKPMLVFKRFSIPSLLTRTTNDITQIQMLFTMDSKWSLVVLSWLFGPLVKSLQVRILALGSSGGSHCQRSAMLT